MLGATANGIMVMDKAANVVTFNRKFVELWGLSDDVVFLGAAEIDSACEAKLVEAEAHFSLLRELREAASEERSEVLTLNDGRVLERHSVPRQIRGELDGRLWSFRDVTERVRAERELREHLSMGIEHAVEGIARLDEQGRYISVNAAYAKMLGYEESEILGTEWAARCLPEDLATAAAARDPKSPGGKTEFEGRSVRKDGSLSVLRALVVRADGPAGDTTSS